MIDEQLVGGGPEEAHRRHGLLGPKVMISSLHGDPVCALAREGPDLDRGLGIQRDAQLVGGRIGLRIHRADVVEDGVGVGDFFWGCVLATLVRV